MHYMLDTNVMWRRFDIHDPRHPAIKAALDALILRGDTLCITAQNLIEFQALATRPVEVNGLGISTLEASKLAKIIAEMFSFLPDTEEIYPKWRILIGTYDVKGKQVHDARLAAVLLAYGITHLITLNPAHFLRFAEIVVVDVQSIL